MLKQDENAADPRPQGWQSQSPTSALESLDTSVSPPQQDVSAVSDLDKDFHAVSLAWRRGEGK